MSILHNLQARIDAILSPLFVNGHAVPHPLNTPADVKLYLSQITLVERNLTLIKTEINNEMHLVSQQYADKESHVGSHPIVGGVFGKEQAKHLSEHDRQHIHHNKTAVLERYHHATLNIDQSIAILDTLKLQINQAKAQTNFQPLPSGPLPPFPPGPLFNYACPFCGFQFQTPGGLVICPRCGQ